MAAIVIDAADKLMGRVASIAAKKALEGNEISIVNAERAVITGGRDFILAEYKHKRERGDQYKGPFFPKLSDRIVRRTIRGMLPKNPRGRAALARIRVYAGRPTDVKGEELDIKKDASISRLKNPRYIRVEELSRSLRS